MNISETSSSPLVTTTTATTSSSSGSGLRGGSAKKGSMMANSKLSDTRVKIEQSVPGEATKKSPQMVVRSAELNDAIQIKRRTGEDSRPIFERQDITVNQGNDDKFQSENNGDGVGNTNTKSQKPNSPSSNSDSSSPERYRHRNRRIASRRNITPLRTNSLDNKDRDSAKDNQDQHEYYHRTPSSSRINNISTNRSDTKIERNNNRTTRKRSKSLTPPSSLKHRIPESEKVPYFRDRAREKDRLIRLYGRDKIRRTRSRSPVIRSTRRRRSLTPNNNKHRQQRRRSSSYDEKYRDRDHSNHSTKYRPSNYSYGGGSSSNGGTRYSSRPHDRLNHRHYYHHHECAKTDGRTNSDAIAPTAAIATAPIATAAPPQQIIIPVAVPTPTADYAYGYTWPTAAPQAPWAAGQAAAMRGPPAAHPHFATFHHPIMPIIPSPLRPNMPPMPPQIGYGPPMPTYNPMGMRPPRYMQYGHHHQNHYNHHRFNSIRHPTGHHYQPRNRKPHN